jgi:hypothetical protein
VLHSSMDDAEAPRYARRPAVRCCRDGCPRPASLAVMYSMSLTLGGRALVAVNVEHAAAEGRVL